MKSKSKIKIGIMIFVMMFSVNSCTLIYNAALLGLAGIAGATAWEDAKSGKTKTYRGTRRVCTAYSANDGGGRRCLDWKDYPIYD